MRHRIESLENPAARSSSPACLQESRTRVATPAGTGREYALELDCAYRVLHDTPAIYGEGKTCHISTASVVCSTQTQLPIHGTVELSIMWPVVLNDRCLLKLVITGDVVAAAPDRAEIRILKYEFRTRPRKAPVQEVHSALPGYAAEPFSCPAQS